MLRRAASQDPHPSRGGRRGPSYAAGTTVAATCARLSADALWSAHGRLIHRARILVYRWVFCPEEQCFAFDIHVHKKGECWLKQQRKFDGLGRNITAPKDPHEGHTTFPQAMRNSPRAIWPWAVETRIWPGEIPEEVPWISGVLAPADAVVVSAPADDRWRKRWCDKHSAKYGPCDGPGAAAVKPL